LTEGRFHGGRKGDMRYGERRGSRCGETGYVFSVRTDVAGEHELVSRVQSRTEIEGTSFADGHQQCNVENSRDIFLVRLRCRMLSTSKSAPPMCS